MSENKKLFGAEDNTLICGYCKHDLPKDNWDNVIIQMSYDADGNMMRCVPCHKGDCDRRMREKISDKYTDRWCLLTDFIDPRSRLEFIMGILNDTADGCHHNREAVEACKHLLIVTAPYVYKKDVSSVIANHSHS